MLKWLEGKKSYILALLAGAVTVAHSLGWIDDQTYVTLMGLLGAGAVAALRAGISKGGHQ